MEALLIVGAALAFTAAIGGLQLWFSDRQWVGMWRGHKVRVHHQRGQVVVDIDGQTTLAQLRRPLQRRHTEQWSHGALGDTTVELTRMFIGGNGEFTMSLTLGGERVPLVEVERSWSGIKALIGLQTSTPGSAETYWKSMAPAAVEPLGDDRWLAACRLLELTRQSAALTTEMRESANSLQAVLRRSFEARLRLGDEDLGALGAAGDEVEAIQAVLEARITAALEAVKSLHMAVISIESRADETLELQRVEQTLATLRADDEVEHFMRRHAQQRATEAARVP